MKFSAEKYKAWYTKLQSYNLSFTEDQAVDYYIRYSENSFGLLKSIILEKFLTTERIEQILIAANSDKIDYLLGIYDFDFSRSKKIDFKVLYNDQIIDSDYKTLMNFLVYDKLKEVIKMPRAKLSAFASSTRDSNSRILTSPTTASQLAKCIGFAHFLWQKHPEIRTAVTDNLIPRYLALEALDKKIKTREIKFFSQDDIASMESVYELDELLLACSTSVTKDFIDVILCR